MSTDTKKQAIIDALRRFIAQRPGLEFGNYGDVKAYRAEMRAITRDRHDAETLLAAVERAHGITGDALQAAFRDAYSGRLSCEVVAVRDVVGSQENTLEYRVTLNYCTGQYFPTEYRKAACAVLASALWDYVREQCMPTPRGDGSYELTINGRTSCYSVGDWLRARFRREFGRHIAARWFS